MQASTDTHTSASASPAGSGGAASAFRENLRANLISGFLVFLIALPLCLGIALAGGYPPVAGVLTAIVGGIVTPLISPSELTIKGPAAGLIVIVLGCVTDFGGTGFGDGVWSATDQTAYQLALGVGCVAAVFQILFGLSKGGILGEFFPTSAVHGMLSAIGVIIMAKQIPVALGVKAAGGPLELIAQIPSEIAHANPRVALIGLTCLAVMFLWPLIPRRMILGKVPAPLVVVLLSVPMALALGFNAEPAGTYAFGGANYELGRRFLVNVPDNLLGALTLPDFSGLQHARAWYWVAMFAVIGTLESMLSAKAVDMLDPWKRKTNLDADTVAVGVGNLVSAGLGGQPMISEIVRSRANIDNGARSRHSNMFHGLFLLLFVVAIPRLISLIPLSALGAMLVYTGFRLAHPREFVHAYKVGPEQLVVFAGTVVAVLATDLLEGIAIGVGIELALHALAGAPLLALLKPRLDVVRVDDDHVMLRVHGAAVFSNWLGVRQALKRLTSSCVTVDLSSARLVDHTVMERLHDMATEFSASQRTLVVGGLEQHRPVSPHPMAARRLRVAA